MAVGIVLVSHSPELAAGLTVLAGQMAGPDVHIEPAGGDQDGGLGTSDALVRAAIEKADQGDGVLLLCDLGARFSRCARCSTATVMTTSGSWTRPSSKAQLQPR